MHNCIYTNVYNQKHLRGCMDQLNNKMPQHHLYVSCILIMRLKHRDNCPTDHPTPDTRETKAKFIVIYQMLYAMVSIIITYVL